MKIVKVSLVAAVLMSANLFAVENLKVSGDAKLFYETYAPQLDSNKLFEQSNANGQVGFDLGVTGDLSDTLSFGTSIAGTDTLGLENRLVSGVWSGNMTDANGTASTQWWVSEAYLKATIGSTTATIGRQYLDTPLAFSETWNIAANSFTAGVLVNSDLPDTTLIGAYIGQTNGSQKEGSVVAPSDSARSPFTTFAAKGAYAAAAINNSYEPLTVQAWYFAVVDVADATWLQADFSMNGISAGMQHAYINNDNGVNSQAIAAKVAYELKDVVIVSAAISNTKDDGSIAIQNLATGTLAQSKLYTEAWWNYGFVGAAGTTAESILIEAPLSETSDIFLQLNNMALEAKGKDRDALQEATAGINSSVGPVDLSLAYVFSNFVSDDNNNDAITSDATDHRVQVYLTTSF